MLWTHIRSQSHGHKPLLWRRTWDAIRLVAAKHYRWPPGRTRPCQKARATSNATPLPIVQFFNKYNLLWLCPFLDYLDLRLIIPVNKKRIRFSCLSNVKTNTLFDEKQGFCLVQTSSIAENFRCDSPGRSHTLSLATWPNQAMSVGRGCANTSQLILKGSYRTAWKLESEVNLGASEWEKEDIIHKTIYFVLIRYM